MVNTLIGCTIICISISCMHINHREICEKKYTLPRYFENLALEDYINIKPYLKTIFKRPNSKDVETITLFLKYLVEPYLRIIEII